MHSGSHWSRRLRQFIPEFLERQVSLRDLRGEGTVMLHGSTTMGVDDAHSDLDLWWLLSPEAIEALDAVSPTRFLAFELDGKAGHLCGHSLPAFTEQVHRCDMDTIYQLRLAEGIGGDESAGSALKALAQRPMRPEVRETLFFYHYTEMRSEHRACDTPIERGHGTAVLLGMSKALAHALQAAMVLDGQPFPYDKWLHLVAQRTPTGAAVAAEAEALIDALGRGALRQGGPEKGHPIGLALRAMRQTLINAARTGGLDRPWLTEWWLYMDQARAARKAARW